MRINLAILNSCALLVLVTGAARARAQSDATLRGSDPILYNNGLFITSQDGCPNNGYMGRSTPVAPNATLGHGIDGRSARVAEDFEIPPGQSWRLSRLRWRMYQVNTPITTQIARAHVRVWTTSPLAGGAPILGDLATNRHDFTVDSQAHRTGPNTPTSCARRIMDVEIDMQWAPVLPAGQYWVEVALHTDEAATIFGPPTEPRSASDNGILLDLAGEGDVATDGGSGLPLEFPFELTGQVVADPENACVLPGGTCQSATNDECMNVLGGVWSYQYSCAELGACCNFADGICTDLVEPTQCIGETETFFEGFACASIPICGQLNGACCFPDDNPQDCESFTTGIECSSMGGYWHTGSCVGVDCHDYCETPLIVNDGESPFITAGSSTDGPQANQDCALDPLVGTADIWFSYESTLAGPGAIAISVCNNDGFDSTLQVYQTDGATVCSDLNDTALAEYCDNDGCGIPQGPSRLLIGAGPGDTFLIRIGGYDGDNGGGQLEILPIEAGFGACCMQDGSCEVLSAASCDGAGGAFQELADCFNVDATCGQVGACCRGVDGCVETSESVCNLSGGMFLGEATICESPADCDGDGETDFCAFTAGAPDCNSNGVPDSCDIDPVNGISTDCNTNQIPDECDMLPLCCPGDVDHSGTIDALDAVQLVDALLNGVSGCQTQAFCRVDTNADQRLNGNDIASFVELAQNDAICAPVLHVSGRVILAGPITRGNRVFLLDEFGDLLYSYPQIAGADVDSFGYRDGASDGTYVYFGWIGGVARHNADGSGGAQIITGPVPGINATWRALAYDPTGDGGNGSFWTQSFFSDLIETDLAGNLLNQFPNNGSGLYGLAYDDSTGKLWGHGQQPGTGAALIQEIDPETGLLTGVSFPSHFGVPGGSLDDFAQLGGLSTDDAAQTMFGVLQGTMDALISVDSSGALIPPLTPNPRTDIELQFGINGILGIAVVQP